MTYVVQTDLKGNLPKSLVSQVAAQQAFLIAAVRQHMDKAGTREI